MSPAQLAPAQMRENGRIPTTDMEAKIANVSANANQSAQILIMMPAIWVFRLRERPGMCNWPRSNFHFCHNPEHLVEGGSDLKSLPQTGSSKLVERSQRYAAAIGG